MPFQLVDIAPDEVEGEVWAVLWDDAHHNSDQLELKDLPHGPWQYITCGVLVKNDDTGVTLSMDKDGHEETRTHTFVPRKMIVDMWKIGNLRRKRPRAKILKFPSPPSAV